MEEQMTFELLTKEDYWRWHENWLQDKKVTCMVCERPKKYYYRLDWYFIALCGYHKIKEKNTEVD